MAHLEVSSLIMVEDFKRVDLIQDLAWKNRDLVRMRTEVRKRFNGVK